jgi:hypothetical protein
MADYLEIAFTTAWEHGDKPHGKTRRDLQNWLLKNDPNGCYHDLDTARELGGWVASDRDILVSVVRATSGDGLADLLNETLPEDPDSARKAVEGLLMSMAAGVFRWDYEVTPWDWATACEAAGYCFDEEDGDLYDALISNAGHPCPETFIRLVCRTISGAMAAARKGAA